MAQAIVFYISGHGFGHASRTIEVINAILAQRPETRVGVRTSAPRWLFDLTVKGKVTYSTLECDTGVVQIDALTLDEADSIRRASSFHSDLVTRAASETRALRELGAGIIVGYIPPLAFAVGASAGIPSIGLGNFTWDWIYADYPRVRLAPSLLPTIRGAYAKASMALRLPMSGGFESFSNVRDIPFVARHASRSREEVCKLLKLPSDKPIVLASFGGVGLSAIKGSAAFLFPAGVTTPRRGTPPSIMNSSMYACSPQGNRGDCKIDSRIRPAHRAERHMACPSQLMSGPLRRWRLPEARIRSTRSTAWSSACTSSPRNCNDGNPCTTDSCDPATGVRHVLAPAGTPREIVGRREAEAPEREEEDEQDEDGGTGLLDERAVHFVGPEENLHGQDRCRVGDPRRRNGDEGPDAALHRHIQANRRLVQK